MGTERVAACLLWLLLAAAQGLLPHARAQATPAPGLALRIEIPVLVPGSPATVDVYVRVPAGPVRPLSLTPSAEGEALRVLRGRLLRADARRTDGGELHFRVPVEPLSEGTGVLRFALLTYACAERCEAVRLSESRTVEVRSR
jgi:hypothetical protein